MRRTLVSIIAATAAAGTLAACGEASPTGPTGDAAASVAEAEAEAPERLFLGMGTGVKVFDPATASVTVDAAPGVPAQQGTAVFRAIPRSGGTEVTAFDPVGGDAKWSTLLPEPMELRLASQDGTAVVLGPARPTDGTLPGRDTTRLTVVRGPDDVRSFDVAGNVEPETFSADASQLFLIDYLPAAAPTQYTLKLLDLDTGTTGEVFDAHGGHRQPMQGTARTQVYSPDGSRLYTYYQITGAPYYEHGNGPYWAFVHVLDLEEGWAHCVVLSEPFGTSGPNVNGVVERPAVAVSPDGAKVYVADPNLGMLAEIDTEMLRVFRTAEFAAPAPEHPAAAVATDEALLVSTGNEVHSIGRESLAPETSFTMPQPITALYISRGGDRLYAALPDRVEVYDTASYVLVDELLVGNLPVEYFDPGGVGLDATSDVVKCAC